MIRIIKYFFVLFLLISLNTTRGQAIFDTLQLFELEVVGTIDNMKSPTKVTTIDSIQRSDMSLHDIGELLASFTPVFVKSYGRGSVATVSFRGTGASHTKVVWGGMDINSPMLGQTDFSTIPVSLFDNIELRYGGSSLTEVSGALGGSINLSSKKTYNSGNQIDLTQSIGSFQTFLTSASVLLSGEKFGSRTHFTRQSSENNFTYINNAIIPSKEMKQENADFRNIGFTQQLDFRLNENQLLSVVSWNQWNDRNIPPIMTNVNKGGTQNEWQKDFFSRNIATWSYSKSQTNVNVIGAYFYENTDYFLVTTNDLDSVISTVDSRNKVNSYSLSANLEHPVSEYFLFRAGSKILNQTVNSNNYVDIKSRTTWSNFASLTGDLGKFKPELLIRMDLTNGEINPIMPMLGVSFKPLENEELYLRASASKNFNLPSLNDMYWYPNGNDSLLPEEGIEGEISMDYARNLSENHSLLLRSTGYYSIVDNWIVWHPGDYTYWSPENVAVVHSRGAELSVKYSGIFGKTNISLFCEYAHTRATQEKEGYEETQLMYVPKNTLNAFINIEYKGYYFNWGLHFTDTRSTTLNIDEFYGNRLPAYTLNNASIGKKINIKNNLLDIRFKVYNIMNISYQAVLYRAMPGRNFELSMKIKI